MHLLVRRLLGLPPRAQELLLEALLILSLTALTFVGSASGAGRLFVHPVKLGSRGKQVADAQWLLQGNDPNAYRKYIHPLRGHPVTGQFGKRTGRAVLAARWLLGEPIAYNKDCHCRPGKRAIFDRDLYLLLTGRRTRPLGWFRNAAQRRQQRRHATTTRCGARIVADARRELGVHEVPWGSNTGPRVRYYQSHTALGGTGWPWCAAFTQTMYVEAGIGRIADGTAGVYYLVDWARRRGWLRVRPAPGAMVAYLSNSGRIVVKSGHIGIVEAVGRSGFTTIEGNSADQVRRRWRSFGDSTVFVYPDCLRRS